MIYHAKLLEENILQPNKRSTLLLCLRRTIWEVKNSTSRHLPTRSLMLRPYSMWYPCTGTPPSFSGSSMMKSTVVGVSVSIVTLLGTPGTTATFNHHKHLLYNLPTGWHYITQIYCSMNCTSALTSLLQVDDGSGVTQLVGCCTPVRAIDTWLIVLIHCHLSTTQASGLYAQQLANQETSI